MKIARNVISLFMIITMLSTILPVFNTEDANRDTTVGIEDAILFARDLVRVADTPDAFDENIKNIISIMQVLAGIKPIISQPVDKKFGISLSGLTLPYLISLFDFLFVSTTYSKVAEQLFYYQSILFSPESPPPRCFSVY